MPVEIDEKAAESMQPTPHEKKKSREQLTAAPREKQLRILLVEDEDISREVVLRVLRRRGHAITTAACGQEALESQARAGEQAGLSDGIAKLEAEFPRVMSVLEGVVRGDFTS